MSWTRLPYSWIVCAAVSGKWKATLWEEPTWRASDGFDHKSSGSKSSLLTQIATLSKVRLPHGFLFAYLIVGILLECLDSHAAGSSHRSRLHVGNPADDCAASA
eukprot:6270190-Amphidinium_carterae.1